MRTGPRILAALAVVVAGAATAAVPVLASTSTPKVPVAGQVTVPAPDLSQQTATTGRATATTRQPTVTTRRQAATTVATTVATTLPPAVPTLATTVPLPTQSTTLTPITAPPTTATAIDDLEATKLVNRVIAALVGLAVLIALLTFVYWRSTKPVPPALDGLDLMSTRKWLRGKPDKRSRLLNDFHAKRGPVPEEVIVRTAPTVRVGAAVAAPSEPMVVPAMAASGSTLAGLASDDLTDEPPIVVVPDANGSSPAGSSPAGSSPAGSSPAGSSDGSTPEGSAPEASKPAGGEAETERGGAGPDPDASFTVVARRPRGRDHSGSSGT